MTRGEVIKPRKSSLIGSIYNLMRFNGINSWHVYIWYSQTQKGHLLTLKDLRDDSKNPLQKTTPLHYSTPWLHSTPGFSICLFRQRVVKRKVKQSRWFMSGSRGVQVSLTKKSSDVFFFAFFLVLSLFYRSQMVNFKAIYHFSRFQRGLTFSRGVQLFPGGGGGSNCLFPIETHKTCDFPGGYRPPAPPPPSGSALVVSDCFRKLQY